jgi:hypothetical protein
MMPRPPMSYTTAAKSRAFVESQGHFDWCWYFDFKRDAPHGNGTFRWPDGVPLQHEVMVVVAGVYAPGSDWEIIQGASHRARGFDTTGLPDPLVFMPGSHMRLVGVESLVALIAYRGTASFGSFPAVERKP